MLNTEQPEVRMSLSAYRSTLRAEGRQCYGGRVPSVVMFLPYDNLAEN